MVRRGSAVSAAHGSVRWGLSRMRGACYGSIGMIRFGAYRRCMARLGSLGTARADRFVIAGQSRIGLAQQVKDWRGSVPFGSHGSASRVKAMRCTVRLGAAVSDGQRIAMVGSGSVRLGAVRLGSLG